MSNELIVRDELDVTEVTAQVGKVQDLMRRLMKEGEHYGVIPGTNNKPTLLKAGAEKLGFMFRLAPEFAITRADLADNHREYEITCTLRHMANGNVVGQGVGICSTMEAKYRYRNAARKCPNCGQETIIKGKAEYGGGWLCYAKKGGCGAKFADDDPVITKQVTGKVDNPDIADVYNTVLKMAKKRAHIDAIITATAASDIFTQDLEDVVANPDQTAPNSNSVPQSAPAREGEVERLIDVIKIEMSDWTDEEKEPYRARYAAVAGGGDVSGLRKLRDSIIKRNVERETQALAEESRAAAHMIGIDEVPPQDDLF